MTTYKDIRGTHIKTVTTDPPAPLNGQMWYNSTTRVMKGFTSNPVGSWSTGSALNTARSALGGVGIQTAALAFGGGPPPAPAAKNQTESWNGSTWTEVNNLNTQRAYLAAAGLYTSAVASGGDQYSGTSESWNGSSWSNITSSPSGGNAKGGAGADNEECFFWGGTPPTVNTEYWNGSSWTEVNNLNTSVVTGASAGTYAAALSTGGMTGPNTTTGQTESWNGSTWTEVNDLNDARRYIDSYSTGTNTSALVAGGEAPLGAKTESWNGTSWTNTTDMSTARGLLGGAGASNSSSLAYGGANPSTDLGVTEEFVSPTTSTVTFTAS